MDFSGFNAAEQAHMTKVIEKKQVRMLSVPSFGNVSNCNRLDARLYANVFEPF
jgi:hypothetical protein